MMAFLGWPLAEMIVSAAQPKSASIWENLSLPQERIRENVCTSGIDCSPGSKAKETALASREGLQDFL